MTTSVLSSELFIHICPMQEEKRLNILDAGKQTVDRDRLVFGPLFSLRKGGECVCDCVSEWVDERAVGGLMACPNGTGSVRDQE